LRNPRSYAWTAVTSCPNCGQLPATPRERVAVSGVIRQREMLIKICWIRFAFAAGAGARQKRETDDREGNGRECIIRFRW
jgi:hypothetical protein